MDRAAQREIMRQDEERRIQRDIDDYLRLHPVAVAPEHAPHSMVIRADAKAMGAVTAHTVRVNAPWSSLRTRCVGIAPGTEAESDGTPTVLVRHQDGSTEIRTVASFRKGSDRAPRKAAPPATLAQSEVELFGLVNNIGRDYS